MAVAEKNGPMGENELDALLRRSAVTPSRAADATAVQLAREVRNEVAGPVPVRRRRPPRTRIIAGAVAAVVLLTGAGTLAAYQLRIPPFQTLEDVVGLRRSSNSVPVNYTNSLGREVECLAFVEYRNLTRDQRAALEDALQDDRWQGYGQRVLDDLDIPAASPEEQNSAIFEVVGDDLWEAAGGAVPGMAYMTDSDDSPVFYGTSFSCVNPGGVDGRP